MRSVVLALAAAALVGCAGYGTLVGSVPTDADYRVVTRPAPLPRGRVTADCGPEALAAVLAFHGKPADVDEITRRIYRADLKGTLSTAIAPMAREKGLAAELKPGGVARIREEVGKDAPCIVMVEVRPKLFHFFVVVGYSDGRQQIVCEDYDGAKRLIAYEDLERSWEGAGRFLLALSLASAASEADLGREFEARGDFKRAIEHYRRALKHDPADVDALVGLGTCLHQAGDHAGAREAYERAMRVAPEEPTLCNNLADLYVAMGVRAEEAERLAGLATDAFMKERKRLRDELATAPAAQRRAIQEELKNVDLNVASAFGTLGQARSANGRHELAIAAWKASLDVMALDEFDRRARRLLDIGVSYEKLSMPREARLHYAQGLEVARDPALRARLEERLK